MSEFKRQTAEAGILRRVIELAREGGIEVSVRSRSSGRPAHMDFTIWMDTGKRDEKGLVLSPESVRSYESDAGLRGEVDGLIRDYLKKIGKKK